jgi:hypothetical protein
VEDPKPWLLRGVLTAAVNDGSAEV